MSPFGHSDNTILDFILRSITFSPVLTSSPTFDPEFRIDLQVPYAFRLNKPTVQSSGEWILPVTHAGEPVHDWFAGEKQHQGVAISRDKGRTWTLHSKIHASEWAMECMVVELRDGRRHILQRRAAAR